jgi:TPR repeat protein
MIVAAAASALPPTPTPAPQVSRARPVAGSGTASPELGSLAPWQRPVKDDAIAEGEELYLSADYGAAAAYFRSACDRGSAFSCSALGRMILEGKGTTVDVPAGRAFLGRGCHMGDRWGCSLVEQSGTAQNP